MYSLIIYFCDMESKINSYKILIDKYSNQVPQVWFTLIGWLVLIAMIDILVQTSTSTLEQIITTGVYIISIILYSAKFFYITRIFQYIPVSKIKSSVLVRIVIILSWLILIFLIGFISGFLSNQLLKLLIASN